LPLAALAAACTAQLALQPGPSSLSPHRHRCIAPACREFLARGASAHEVRTPHRCPCWRPSRQVFASERKTSRPLFFISGGTGAPVGRVRRWVGSSAASLCVSRELAGGLCGQLAAQRVGRLGLVPQRPGAVGLEALGFEIRVSLEPLCRRATHSRPRYRDKIQYQAPSLKPSSASTAPAVTQPSMDRHPAAPSAITRQPCPLRTQPNTGARPRWLTNGASSVI
jgi:hypothetical protein